MNAAKLIGALALLAGAAYAGDEKSGTDAKEILRKSVQAIQDAKSISYNIIIEAEGWISEFVPQSKGKVIFGGRAKYDVPRFRCEATLTKKVPAEEGKDAKPYGDAKEAKEPKIETVSYVAGSDGNEYYLLDAKTKKAHHDLDPVVLGSDAQNLQRLTIREFVDKEPYKNELEEEKVTLDGTETIGGVECDKVEVVFAKGRPSKATWYIGRPDHLPRRVRRIYPAQKPGEADGATVTTLSEVKIDAADAAKFKFAVPEGYTATDEFAP